MQVRARICWRPSARAGGFSLAELLVVIAIITILAAIFIPYFSQIRETDRRVRCADNLRAIMEGLHQYSMLKNGHGQGHLYPATPADPNRGGYTAYSAPDAADPFAPGGVKPNDVTASLWLLVRLGLVPPQRFICPSSSNVADSLTGRLGGRALPAERSNFSSGANLSYSYACPFSTAPGYKMDDDSHVADFAMIADKNPGSSGKFGSVTTPNFDAEPFSLSRANSRNHGKVGQNVLYADGHVSFQTTPYCGVGHDARRDNIFTALSPIPLSPGQRPPVESNGYFGRDIGPAWTNDSYLVPSEED